MKVMRVICGKFPTVNFKALLTTTYLVPVIVDMRNLLTVFKEAAAIIPVYLF